MRRGKRQRTGFRLVEADGAMIVGHQNRAAPVGLVSPACACVPDSLGEDDEGAWCIAMDVYIGIDKYRYRWRDVDTERNVDIDISQGLYYSTGALLSLSRRGEMNKPQCSHAW